MKETYPLEQKDVVNLLEQMGQTRVDYPPELLSTAQTVFHRKVSVTRARMAEANPSSGHGASVAQGGGATIAWASVFQVALAALVTGLLLAATYLLMEERTPVILQSTPTPAHFAPLESDAPELAPVVVETAAPVAPHPASATSVNLAPKPEVTRSAQSTATHPGKHLGQTPGAPNAPGQEKTPKKP